MSDSREPADLGLAPDEVEEELVEIDWGPLQAGLDAMAAEGLDFQDNEGLMNHWAAFLGALLRKVQGDENAPEEELAEMAAEVAAFAVDLAVSEEDLPEFLPSSQQEEN
ncbi:MAG: hypothetical protein AAF725_09545 [Acidobacteriota bacterium]